MDRRSILPPGALDRRSAMGLPYGDHRVHKLVLASVLEALERLVEVVDRQAVQVAHQATRVHEVRVGAAHEVRINVGASSRRATDRRKFTHYFVEMYVRGSPNMS